MNRVAPVVNQMVGGPSYNMNILLSVLSPSGIAPRPDKYYVFVYKAKTKGIVYDRHPFIQCFNVFPYGFNGVNDHWKEVRQYSWREVLSNLYEIRDEEVDMVRQLDIALFKNT